MTTPPKRGDYLARHGAQLIANGYQVVPIRPGDKAPGPDNWQELRSDGQLLNQWLSNGYAHSGVGILTKDTPAVDIDVLDDDIVRELVEWVQQNVAAAPIRIGKAPKALMLFSASAPFRKITSASFIDPKNPTITDGPKKGKVLKQRIEVLGDGQQFVAYHIHPETGRPYEWTTTDDPLCVGVLDLPILGAEAARAICDQFERVATRMGWTLAAPGSSDGATGDTATADRDALAEILPPEETPAEVARVKAALKAISGEVVSGFDYDRWLSVMFALKWTRWECAEDLAYEWSKTSDNHGDDHFYRTWKGAQKRIRGKEVTIATVFGFAKEHGWDSSRKPDDELVLQEQADKYEELVIELEFMPVRDPKARAKFLKQLAMAKLQPGDVETLLSELKKATKISLPTLRKELKTHENDGHKPTHAGYATQLVEKLNDESGHMPVGVEASLYTFSREDGVWQGKIATLYAVDVAKDFDGMERCERRSDYVAIASQAYDTVADGNEEFFEQAPLGLACEGRFYTVEADGTISREKLRASHRQRYLSPARPVVGEMPLFEKFLDQTFDGVGKDEQVALLQEIIGATLLGSMARYEKAVLLKGPGRSGKGTILKIIQAMMPKNSVSAVSPFNWDGEYYLANLAGKRLNIVGELPDDQPIPAAAFKSVTGRDEMTGRHPGMRPFTFRNAATHIFNSNYYIFTKDHSETFYGRWLLMRFGNSRIRVEEGVDTNLAKKIIDSELPAVMAWALQGAKRLHERGHFLETSVHKFMLQEWNQRTSTLMEFLFDSEEIEMGTSKNHTIRRSEFYFAYSNYCKASGRRAMGKQKLYDELEEAQYGDLGLSFATEHGKQRVIKGLRFIRPDEGAWKTVDDDTEL